jgi:histidine ammonia-lyase
MLNRYLGKNNITNNPHFEYLRILLKKYSYLVGENKILSIPSAIDTVLMHDYKHDLYVHEGTAHVRLTALFKNLKYLFKLELMTALEVIDDMYVDENHSLFLNQEIESVF